MSVPVRRLFVGLLPAALALGLSAPVAAAAAPADAAPAAPGGGVSISTLSNRADLVSGGDVLTAVDLPAGTAPATVVMTLNGTVVTNQFAARPNGRYEGLLTGLREGENTLTATVPGGNGAKLSIRNHPLGGPVFAGPQIQPWTCPAGAQDSQCDRPPSYAYYYVPVASSAGFQSYDPSNPPPASAIASTTTTDGVTVPFIVRQETGYIDRDQYVVAALFQPGKPWQPWAPQPQSNGRLVITHGASCDEQYQSASAPSVLDQKVLGGGFTVMSNALDNAGHNCNLVTQGEALVMTKEYVIDHYGAVRWTIGSGCSGGSLVQQQLANAYPGLYQGISPQCSFTDAWSSNMEYADYSMLLKYFSDASRSGSDAFTAAQISSVIDHPNVGNPVTFTTVIPNNLDPTHSCAGLSSAQQYNATSNPKGVRCDLQDYMINVFGPRASDGYANEPFDNVGIQYGLKGLRAGILSPQQFVDLNHNLGGLDKDAQVQAARIVADLPGLQRVYASGGANEANNLNQVAIIDLRGPDPGAFHDVYRTYAMRARLLRNFGTAANQVLWRGQSPIMGDQTFADAAVFALDTWLGRIDADHTDIPLAQKVIQDKPGTVADRCTDGNGTDVASTICDASVQAYGTPRFAADEPMTDDVIKCQLKSLRRDDYPVTFTDAQWADLQSAFPTGVCDYSKPGVAQTGAVAWQTYQEPDGTVIYGGRAMGSAPTSVPLDASAAPADLPEVPLPGLLPVAGLLVGGLALAAVRRRRRA